MESERWSLHLQEPVTCPYPDPEQSSPRLSHFLKAHFNIIPPHVRVGFSMGSSEVESFCK
jgi:hypothetical protein